MNSRPVPGEERQERVQFHGRVQLFTVQHEKSFSSIINKWAPTIHSHSLVVIANEDRAVRSETIRL